MSDILADRFLALADLADDGDWRDVGRRARRGNRRSTPSLFIAAMLGAAAVAAPALAFSPSVRQLVGLKGTSPPPGVVGSWPRPKLVARVTGAFIHTPRPRFGPPLVTVTFTIGEAGRPPGTGIPFGSYFLVSLSSRTGAPSAPWQVRAYGTHGHYSATTHLPAGGIASVQIGGWVNVRKGSSAADGDFWIPVTVVYPLH